MHLVAMTLAEEVFHSGAMKDEVTDASACLRVDMTRLPSRLLPLRVGLTRLPPLPLKIDMTRLPTRLPPLRIDLTVGTYSAYNPTLCLRLPNWLNYHRCRRFPYSPDH